MQLLHQTCRSRIDRLNDTAVSGGSSWKKRPAAIQRIDEEPDVIGATEAIRTHLLARSAPANTWP